jgi:hypothetical protein
MGHTLVIETGDKSVRIVFEGFFSILVPVLKQSRELLEC